MPVVTLKMGSSLNPDDIKEGADVYFECLILSNPKPYKMSWFHNVSCPTGGGAFECEAPALLRAMLLLISFAPPT